MKKMGLITILMLLCSVFIISAVQVSAAETGDYLPSSQSKQYDIESEYLYMDDVWFPIVYQDFDSEINEKAYFRNNNAEYVFKYDISDSTVYEEWVAWILQMTDVNPSYNFQISWSFGLENSIDFTLDDVDWLSSEDDFTYQGSISDNTLVLFTSFTPDYLDSVFESSSGIDLVYGGDGNIYFKECMISITALPQSYDEDVYHQNIGVDYNQLPESENIFIDVFGWSVIDYETNTYELILVTDLHPDNLINEQYNKFYWFFLVTLDSELDYSSMKTRQIKYVTNNESNKILIFDLESDQLGNQIYTINDIDSPARLYRSTYTINLSTQEVYKYDDFAVNAVVKKGANSVAYLNMYLPMRVEELISLSLNISYSIDELFRLQDPTIEEKRYYECGTQTEINPPSWTFWLTAGYLYNSLDRLDVYNMDTIQEVTAFDEETNNLALNTLLLSENTIEDSRKYQVALGQFSTLTSIGYDISEVALVNMIYESEGIYYEVSEDLLDTNTTIVIDETDEGFLDKALDFVDSLFDGTDDTSSEEPSFFDELNNTSKLIFSGVILVLTFVIVIKVIDSRKRR